MDYQDILFSINDGLAVITLNRPDSLNALTARMRAEITHATKEAATQARALVLTGAGKAFCSGQDLKDASGAGGGLDLERTLHDEYTPMILALTSAPIPVLAAVNGAAAGAGCSLALAADVVIASERAYFMQAFSRIGLMPDAGGTWAMPRKVGLARAMGASLFGDKISARQAESWGLIWEAVEEDAFDVLWRDRAATLAAGPTQAYGRIKAALRAGLDVDLQTQLAQEARLQGECGQTRDFLEGVTAFTEKRSARFEGR